MSEIERRRAKLLAQPAVGATTVWILAEWPGVCYGCGNGFEKGAAIRRVQAVLGIAYKADCCAGETG